MIAHKGSADRDPLAALAARAREEVAPQVDVTANVIRRLRTTPAPVYDRALYWITAGAVAAAAIIAVMALPELHQATDPLAVYFEANASSPL